ncbi:hypothetical protein JTE90_004779 [Oedothorax gibbosus]|uniref:Uncharacterized protein n=1 Tax=Oedothorax gibbosus TaxID=931172 RepID=A0AAV6VI64_9ARAC|nr:hypothetical protein JTE90_004779 [Oedothorax gibbosus]
MQMDSYSNHQMGGHEPWAMDLNSGSHALAELHSASENIDSLVQQLSMSPDVIKANPSDSIQTFQNENFNDYGGLSNYNGGESTKNEVASCATVGKELEEYATVKSFKAGKTNITWTLPRTMLDSSYLVFVSDCRIPKCPRQQPTEKAREKPHRRLGCRGQIKQVHIKMVSCRFMCIAVLVVLVGAAIFPADVMAGGLKYKRLLAGYLIAKAIKPRFVPIPLPLPFPIKLGKDTHVKYPVHPQHSLTPAHPRSLPRSWRLRRRIRGDSKAIRIEVDRVTRDYSLVTIATRRLR